MNSREQRLQPGGGRAVSALLSTTTTSDAPGRTEEKLRRLALKRKLSDHPAAALNHHQQQQQAAGAGACAASNNDGGAVVVVERERGVDLLACSAHLVTRDALVSSRHVPPHLRVRMRSPQRPHGVGGGVAVLTRRRMLLGRGRVPLVVRQREGAVCC